MVNARSVVLDSNGNATVSGAIGAIGDDDWFTFTATKAGLLVIESDTPNSSLDTHIRLHNESVLLVQDPDRIEREVKNAGETLLAARTRGK